MSLHHRPAKQLHSLFFNLRQSRAAFPCFRAAILLDAPARSRRPRAPARPRPAAGLPPRPPRACTGVAPRASPRVDPCARSLGRSPSRSPPTRARAARAPAPHGPPPPAPSPVRAAPGPAQLCLPPLCSALPPLRSVYSALLYIVCLPSPPSRGLKKKSRSCSLCSAASMRLLPPFLGLLLVLLLFHNCLLTQPHHFHGSLILVLRFT